MCIRDRFYKLANAFPEFGFQKKDFPRNVTVFVLVFQNSRARAYDWIYPWSSASSLIALKIFQTLHVNITDQKIWLVICWFLYQKSRLRETGRLSCRPPLSTSKRHFLPKKEKGKLQLHGLNATNCKVVND